MAEQQETGMYTLYAAPNCGSFVVHALMDEAGAAYRLVEIDLAKREHRAKPYLDVNPMGTIPALDVGGSRIMTESAAMAIYLVDHFPEAGLGPPPGAAERPAFLSWLEFLAVNTYQATEREYRPEWYTTVPEECEGLKAAAVRHMDEQFAMIDKALEVSRYLAGAHRSAADLYLLMIAQWHPAPDTLFEACPNVARVCDEERRRDVSARLNAYYKIW
jgi:glutathione S-transferase